MIGFTGVVWEARTPQRLAADLRTGPGERPLTAATCDWRAVAVELESAADEVDALLAGLGEAWISGAAGVVAARLGEVGGWLRAQAARADDVSVSAHAHAIGVVVARTTMPHPAETDAAVTVRDKVLGHDPVSALTGAAGAVEWLIEQQRLAASRVMSAYETAAERVCLATPIPLPPPPLPAAVAAATAAVTRAVESPGSVSALPTAAAAMPAAIVGMAGAPRPRTAYVHADLIPDSTRSVTETGPAAPDRSAAVDADTTRPATSPASEHLPPAAPLAPAPTGPVTGTSAASGSSTGPASGAVAMAERASVRVPATDDHPVTWAQVAVADSAIADHAASPYATERLRLDGRGGQT